MRQVHLLDTNNNLMFLMFLDKVHHTTVVDLKVPAKVAMEMVMEDIDRRY